MNGDNRSQLNGEPSPDLLYEMVNAFRRSRVLLTAYELGVFSMLGDRSRTSEEVAAAIDSDERATDRLMNALSAMGLLKKEEGRFSNRALASRFLVEGKPEFFAGLMHSVNLWDSWSTLTEAVRSGTSVAGVRVSERGDEWRESFIAAMHDRAWRQASKIVAGMDLAGVSTVLDLGGGSGAFAMAFVEAAEGIRVTVFDLPEVIPLTERYIEEAGLSDKVQTIAGDYRSDDPGSSFDLVFLSAIVHSNSPEVNRDLIRKCSDALKPGGRVVVQDFIMSDDRTEPTRGALFALNMLVNTEAGDTYTESEIMDWMEAAGLTDFSRLDTGYGSSQISGRKPPDD